MIDDGDCGEIGGMKIGVTLTLKDESFGNFLFVT
jgi:hypothetical protein